MTFISILSDDECPADLPKPRDPYAEDEYDPDDDRYIREPFTNEIEP